MERCDICNRKLTKKESYDEHKKFFNLNGREFIDGLKFEMLFKMDMKDAHCVVSHGYNLIKDNSSLKDVDDEGNIKEDYNEEVKEEKDEDNHEKQNADKIKCECGSLINKNGLTKHKKTKKHIEYGK